MGWVTIRGARVFIDKSGESHFGPSAGMIAKIEARGEASAKEIVTHDARSKAALRDLDTPFKLQPVSKVKSSEQHIKEATDKARSFEKQIDNHIRFMEDRYSEANDAEDSGSAQQARERIHELKKAKETLAAYKKEASAAKTHTRAAAIHKKMQSLADKLGGIDLVGKAEDF